MAATYAYEAGMAIVDNQAVKATGCLFNVRHPASCKV